MKLFRYWKIVLGLVLIFGAGAVTGSLVTQHMIKRALESSMKFENWANGMTRFLQGKLKLSPEQRQKVQTIFDQKGPEVKAIFARTLADCGRIVIRTEREVDLELTPDQRAIHTELKRRGRADLKSKFDFDLPLE